MEPDIEFDIESAMPRHAWRATWQESRGCGRSWEMSGCERSSELNIGLNIYSILTLLETPNIEFHIFPSPSLNVGTDLLQFTR